jgi:hypothetical protein
MDGGGVPLAIGLDHRQFKQQIETLQGPPPQHVTPVQTSPAKKAIAKHKTKADPMYKQKVKDRMRMNSKLTSGAKLI